MPNSPRRGPKKRIPKSPSGRARPITAAYFPRGVPVNTWSSHTLLVDTSTGQHTLGNPRLVYTGMERRGNERRTGKTDRRMPELRLDTSIFTGRRKSAGRKYDRRYKNDKKIPRIVFKTIIKSFNIQVRNYALSKRIPFAKARMEFIEQAEKNNFFLIGKFLDPKTNVLYAVKYLPRTGKFEWSSTQRIRDRRIDERRDLTNFIESQSDPQNN